MTIKETTGPEPANTSQPDDKIPSSASSSSSSIIYTPLSPSSMSSTSASNAGPATTGPVTTGRPTQPVGVANISIREYIYFLPYPLPPNTPVPYSIHLPGQNPLNYPPHQFEPTSTLVLTSPCNTFIDVRLYKPMRPGESALPNKGERERLEWAFAGSGTSVPIADPHVPPSGDEEPWPGVTKSTWTHWLDSRHRVGATDVPVDEGIMYPLDAARTLEHGHAFHPALRAVKTHEELWRDVPVLATSAGAKKACVVLRLQNDAAGARGVIVRLGQYCQGIVMLGAYSTVERWEFDGKAEKGKGDGDGQAVREGGWVRTARVGDQFLPCGITWREEILCLGGKVRYMDYEWEVEEAWEW